MSVPATNGNGEAKTLGRLQALWPVIVAIVIVVWTISSQLSDIAILRKEQEESKQERDLLKEQITLLKAKQSEVETQFDSMAQSLNIQFAETQRRLGELQNAIHEMGGRVPQAPSGPWYFPNISNRTGGH
jgi:hypothetical protein